MVTILYFQKLKKTLPLLVLKVPEETTVADPTLVFLLGLRMSP